MDLNKEQDGRIDLVARKGKFRVAVEYGSDPKYEW